MARTDAGSNIGFIGLFGPALSVRSEGTAVLVNSSIRLQLSGRMQDSGGGAGRDPVAINADFLYLMRVLCARVESVCTVLFE
mmetsp:Transcript_30928/g.69853  ORF Transcript_30928/g.69853 Transcript_30928/m.69853 type:complete len:82 (+) Transcript_30928:1861-2106(+)